MMNSYYSLAVIAALAISVWTAVLAYRTRRQAESFAPKTTMPSWTASRQEYQELAQEIVPSVRLTTKDGWFWRCVAWTLYLMSLGRVPRKRFLQDYATTIGPIHAYPRHWPQIPLEVLVHEARHTHQFLVAGWFVPVIGWLGSSVRVWVGFLPMAIVYGIFPVPVFLAWGRFRLELDAESFAWKWGLDRGRLSADQVRRRAIWAAQQVAGWMYLKAWPIKWATRAYVKRAEQIISDWQAGNTSDQSSG
jgi:hypothetical protein